VIPTVPNHKVGEILEQCNGVEAFVKMLTDRVVDASIFIKCVMLTLCDGTCRALALLLPLQDELKSKLSDPLEVLGIKDGETHEDMIHKTVMVSGIQAVAKLHHDNPRREEILVQLMESAPLCDEEIHAAERTVARLDEAYAEDGEGPLDELERVMLQGAETRNEEGMVNGEALEQSPSSSPKNWRAEGARAEYRQLTTAQLKALMQLREIDVVCLEKEDMVGALHDADWAPNAETAPPAAATTANATDANTTIVNTGTANATSFGRCQRACCTVAEGIECTECAAEETTSGTVESSEPNAPEANTTEAESSQAEYEAAAGTSEEPAWTTPFCSPRTNEDSVRMVRSGSSSGIIGTFVQDKMPLFTHLLMTSVAVEDVSMDNMCVINAAVVCFITARSTLGSELPVLLQQVLDLHVRTTPCSPTTTAASKKAALAGGFLKLLSFWEEFYEGHPGDRKVLEFSSGLEFPHWKEVVTALHKELDRVKEL